MLADDTVLYAESEEELQRVVDAFYSVCTRRKLKVSRIMVIERKEAGWEILVHRVG